MSNQDSKPKVLSIDRRHGRPQTIGAALGNLFDILGIRASDADLANRWEKIMGPEIASVAKLAAIKKTPKNKYNVVIRPFNPAMTLQLSYMKDEIIERINKYFGRDAVEKISFRK